MHPWKTPLESRPFAALSWLSEEENIPYPEISFSLRNPPVRTFDFRSQGFSSPLTRRRSSYPPPSPNLVLTHPVEHATVRLRVLRLSATMPPAHVQLPPEGHQIGARKRRMWIINYKFEFNSTSDIPAVFSRRLCMNVLQFVRTVCMEVPPISKTSPRPFHTYVLLSFLLALVPTQQQWQPVRYLNR